MDRELRILILEDDSTDAELMQRELRNAGITFSPMLVASRKEFIKGLEEFSPDLILSDYTLPSFDGISALAISQEKYPDIPFIFVTGTMGEDWAVETLKQGATDYILKDRPNRLAFAVRRALEGVEQLKERKKAEKALQQSEEKYRGIFENALEGIFQVLPDGRYLIVNPAFVNMLGYKSRAELIAAVSDGSDQLYIQQERYNELKQLLDEHSVVQEFEIQMYHKNGSIIWISLNAHTICDDHETLLYYEGTAQNITEQKKIRDAVKPSKLLLRILGIFAVAEVLIVFIFSLIDIPHGIWEDLADDVFLTIICAPFVYWWVVKSLTRHLVHEITVTQTEAQANEHRYRTLIETAPDIIYTLAVGDGRITSLNSAFEDITGWSCDEWIGKTFVSLVHSEDLPLVMETSQQVLRGENPPSYELRILTKSGEYLVGEFISVPQFERGKIIGELGIARDITERKRAEEELIIAKDRAEESDRLKSAFLANMSHEVRTPLNSIIGFSELLADPDFEEEQKDQFIQHIITSGNNLLSIISDIMDISKMESGEITIRNKQINARNFILTVTEKFSFQTEAKKLELKLTLPDNDKETAVFADSDRLSQVFNNLISNAIKFTENGSIEIGYQPKGKMVEFYVKDTGIGIPAEFHRIIFERFRQVEAEKTRKYGGNGLGLSISKNLVELMGGKIWLESDPDPDSYREYREGKGSVFYFTLPAYNSEWSVFSIGFNH